MIYLTPKRVTLGAVELTHVASITLDRTPDLVNVEHSDLGPHVAFVDVPQQRVTITIVRTPVADEAGTIKPGHSATLTFKSAPSPASPTARQVSAGVVVTSIEHDYITKGGLRQTISCIGVSTDSIADPVTESLVNGGG